MVDRISGGGESLWREAILAAQKQLASEAGDVARQARAVQNAARGVSSRAGGVFADAMESARGASFAGSLRPSGATPERAAGTADEIGRTPEAATASGIPAVGELAEGLRGVDDLPLAMVEGRVDGFQELAVRVKSADLSFRFALEVRNKLIDAYREVMRMSV